MRDFYTTGSRNFFFFFNSSMQPMVNHRRSLVQRYSRLFKMICSSLLTTLLVILSMFLLSRKASPPPPNRTRNCPHTSSSLHGNVFFFFSLDQTRHFRVRKILPLIIPKDVLMQVYVIFKIRISQFVGEFQRETLCIGNAVSHKCVLAFITKTKKNKKQIDNGEWML